MFKRPTSRRKSHQEQIELNLVPILDAMVTLIGFLLFTTSFLVIVGIESQLPQSSADQVQDQIKEKPLQLTLTFREKEVEIWSPFQKIEAKVIPNTAEGAPDSKAIHEFLIEVKKKFPTEVSIVFAPIRASLYENLVATMDAARILEPTDPPIYMKNEKTGVDEPAKALFPKIVFGNLLGDT